VAKHVVGHPLEVPCAALVVHRAMTTCPDGVISISALSYYLSATADLKIRDVDDHLVAFYKQCARL
jgi:hypothetical protein